MYEQYTPAVCGVFTPHSCTALRYARNSFTSVEPNMMTELQEAMALLAFRTDTKCKKYQVCHRARGACGSCRMYVCILYVCMYVRMCMHGFRSATISSLSQGEGCVIKGRGVSSGVGCGPFVLICLWKL